MHLMQKNKGFGAKYSASGLEDCLNAFRNVHFSLWIVKLLDISGVQSRMQNYEGLIMRLGRYHYTGSNFRLKSAAVCFCCGCPAPIRTPSHPNTLAVTTLCIDFHMDSRGFRLPRDKYTVTVTVTVRSREAMLSSKDNGSRVSESLLS